MFIKGNLTVILLIDIQIFHQALMQEVFKVSRDKLKKRQKSQDLAFKILNGKIISNVSSL